MTCHCPEGRQPLPFVFTVLDGFRQIVKEGIFDGSRCYVSTESMGYFKDAQVGRLETDNTALRAMSAVGVSAGSPWQKHVCRNDSNACKYACFQRARCASLFMLVCLGAAWHGSMCSEYYIPIDKPYVRGSGSLVKWDPIIFALQVRSLGWVSV